MTKQKKVEKPVGQLTSMAALNKFAEAKAKEVSGKKEPPIEAESSGLRRSSRVAQNEKISYVEVCGGSSEDLRSDESADSDSAVSEGEKRILTDEDDSYVEEKFKFNFFKIIS